MLYSNIKALCDKQNLSISQLERDLEFPRSSICKWDDFVNIAQKRWLIMCKKRAILSLGVYLVASHG